MFSKLWKYKKINITKQGFPLLCNISKHFFYFLHILYILINSSRNLNSRRIFLNTKAMCKNSRKNNINKSWKPLNNTSLRKTLLNKENNVQLQSLLELVAKSRVRQCWRVMQPFKHGGTSCTVSALLVKVLCSCVKVNSQMYCA